MSSFEQRLKTLEGKLPKPTLSAPPMTAAELKLVFLKIHGDLMDGKDPSEKLPADLSPIARDPEVIAAMETFLRKYRTERGEPLGAAEPVMEIPLPPMNE